MHDHKVRQDNKVRLSPDVLDKADRIAAEWGLKNARAAVEAVFRRYCDEYLCGCPPAVGPGVLASEQSAGGYGRPQTVREGSVSRPASQCEALDALDQLLAL
ncbi:hypothetical protein [Nodosilinea sp. LEGE 07088]|uniref:hypothetical protein n=1 Tax=Nodosilinea sp. LEGE 07088 TaxID=2777968 RepID=UPI0018824AB0|nr:hypothetical protein [Nodosilinea sp. LEGE 07088]